MDNGAFLMFHYSMQDTCSSLTAMGQKGQSFRREGLKKEGQIGMGGKYFDTNTTYHSTRVIFCLVQSIFFTVLLRFLLSCLQGWLNMMNMTKLKTSFKTVIQKSCPGTNDWRCWLCTLAELRSLTLPSLVLLPWLGQTWLLMAGTISITCLTQTRTCYNINILKAY